MSAYLVGKLEYVPELNAYIMREVSTASEDADHLTREFDGKSMLVTLLSADAPSFGEALNKMRKELEFRADVDKAWVPIAKMLSQSRRT